MAEGRRTLSQRRAQAALKAIQKYRDEAPPKEPANYAGYIKSMPASILMNGLGQALATELAQGKKDPAKGQGGSAPGAHTQIYQHLEAWLCGADPEAPFRGRMNGFDPSEPILMHALCEADQHTYLLAQAEAMAYIGWLKKFANAFLTDTAGAS